MRERRTNRLCTYIPHLFGRTYRLGLRRGPNAESVLNSASSNAVKPVAGLPMMLQFVTHAPNSFPSVAKASNWLSSFFGSHVSSEARMDTHSPLATLIPAFCAALAPLFGW